ncbi:MAG: indole-3-glycerol phosphate synthase TrpC [Bacteroidales bacterium]
MNILQTIVQNKRAEILEMKKKNPLSSFETFPAYRRSANRIDAGMVEDCPGIIAEFKRRSPSKGSLNEEALPVEVAGGYREAGAAAMSILTDRKFFGGSFRDLLDVRNEFPDLTLLRKDFIVDPYQLHEARAYGADMVLLIASLLDRQQVADLAVEAGTLGLQVLFEVHEARELEKYHPSIALVGVNNRDLNTFRVDTGKSRELIRLMPEGVLAVSESGISRMEDIQMLWESGFKLFLVGETLMVQKDPGKACKDLIEKIKAQCSVH